MLLAVWPWDSAAKLRMVFATSTGPWAMSRNNKVKRRCSITAAFCCSSLSSCPFCWYCCIFHLVNIGPWNSNEDAAKRLTYILSFLEVVWFWMVTCAIYSLGIFLWLHGETQGLSFSEVSHCMFGWLVCVSVKVELNKYMPMKLRYDMQCERFKAIQDTWPHSNFCINNFVAFLQILSRTITLS